MQGEIDILIKKLNGSLNPKEAVLFDNWINQSIENKKFYEKLLLLKSQGGDLQELQNLDTHKAWEAVLNKVESRKTIVQMPVRRKLSFWHYAAVAAVAGILITLNFLYRPFKDVTDYSNTLSIETEDGAIEVIDSERTIKLFDKAGSQIASQQADTLSYKFSQAKKEIAYNTLNVPNGNTFTLKLGDGSVVRLNAGSRLTYPVNFKPGQERLLSLKGEAYFMVSKSKKQPFIINTHGVNVEVLGTSFNINSYSEDNTVAVALVEGSVKMYDDLDKDSQSIMLSPNQLGLYTKQEATLNVTDADMWEHTAWLAGRLIIRDASFSDILKKIERKYGVRVINKNTTIKEERFNASFDVETVTEVLEAFAIDTPFNFTYKDNVITITDI
ncbi:FecR family protein [Leeuwenhoekiella aestuarii]|uniref:FecR family protein n=1 Tax=Leeuwenhoekiella aestuarii TaxID=2249426 RepID=A0A4Q0NWG9_9FLAO|nr:FecR family protein [Leeuwenhoekiella aestuarii]RXG15959.1 FecR family protein [Leeuwenhoekiella aestuarii]RXG16653.1 FecR family protein [Leeuwenhoekiella aestuarii]